MCSPVRILRRKASRCQGLPFAIKTGPVRLMPTPRLIRSGAQARAYSSPQIICSSTPSSRPPNAFGQASPAQPPSKSLPCHQRVKRMRSAAVSGPR